MRTSGVMTFAISPPLPESQPYVICLPYALSIRHLQRRILPALQNSVTDFLKYQLTYLLSSLTIPSVFMS